MEKTYFIVKIPKENYKPYAIFKEVRKEKSRRYAKVTSEALNSINQSILSKRRVAAECLVQVREIVQQLYAKNSEEKMRNVHNFDNMDLLTKFLKHEYEDKDIVDFNSARNDYLRALNAVGEHSLYSASKEVLQKQINSKFKGNKQRRIVSRLNTIFKFIKRDISLRKDKENQTLVKYLSEADFLEILSKIQNPTVKVLCRIAFYSGCRLGEIFALNQTSLRGHRLQVYNQIDRHNVRRETKNRKLRIAYLFKQGIGDVQAWIKIKEKESYRKLKLASIVRKACKANFPDEPEKWINFHDLRHSYAINLLSNGVSLGLVAQSLGNSIVVCQKHYVGFVMTDDSISRIDSLLNEKI